ncbi:MAG: class II fructose-bisphosphatase [Anaerolineae bacterium]|nr:class II fructose-bisphosphatase [Anaerolineae bacterium]MCB0178793.1 class II fructose-bisphosphatase [Anaerolineae bacterium]MCB0222092.1 class II fructose-bisphosphatase [Anaerolineae bacterium]MCB9106155.1 class II fructose-bisphosphatase [Anaerolineales bacterium]
MDRTPSRNIGLDLVRVTEATALTAGRWLGLGNREMTHRAATEAMSLALASINIDGYIVIGEEGRIKEHTPLDTGRRVGTGQGPEVDVVVDPIDGTNSVVTGRTGAISVICVAPRHSMWDCKPAAYMDKIIVDADAADALIPECMDAPAGWTLAAIARTKGKSIRDLQVIVLDRPRHKDLIEEIRKSGARVLLRPDGDTAGALIAATPGAGPDVLMGIGGASEGVTAACGVRAIGGAMLARLAPQSDDEWTAVKEAGMDTKRILTCHELVSSNQIFLAATGITDGPLLNGVEYWGHRAKTYSLVLRGETGTRRTIHAEHRVALE